jgi:hypothetical protein
MKIYFQTPHMCLPLSFAALDAADCCCCCFFRRAKTDEKDERGKEQLLPLSGIAGSSIIPRSVAVLSDAL